LLVTAGTCAEPDLKEINCQTINKLLMKNKTLITHLTRLCVCALLAAGIFSCTENHYKKYIIEHKSELRIQDKEFVRIDSIKDSYFTDITINIKKDSSLYVIFWGDRDSWQWTFRLDNDFAIDIPYNRYKGKNIKLDLQILEAVNACR
jgi:hypothetical protein